MKLLKKLFKSKDLPEVYKNLIDVIRKHHETSGGENRAAVAELQARSAWELNRATNFDQGAFRCLRAWSR
jgi:hypothetical protein